MIHLVNTEKEISTAVACDLDSISLNTQIKIKTSFLTFRKPV